MKFSVHFILAFSSTSILLSCKIDTEVARSPLSKNLNGTVGRDSIEILETFVDSTSIGVKDRNMIELSYYRRRDSMYVGIVLLSRGSNLDWSIRQQLTLSVDDIVPFDPRTEVLNGDTCNDLSIRALSPARGGNEVRMNYLYDVSGDSLTPILNSFDYPNTQYNSALGCYESFMIHGTRTHVFMLLKGQEFFPFLEADIDGTDEGVIYEVVSYVFNGSDKLVSRKPIDFDQIYVGYEDFKTVKRYRDKALRR